MSIAEITARKVFTTYHLDTMPEDVKMHLIMLLAETSVKKRESYKEQLDKDEDIDMAGEEVPPMLSMSEINARIDQAEADIKAGNTRPVDEFFDEMDAKYPWLCK